MPNGTQEKQYLDNYERFCQQIWWKKAKKAHLAGKNNLYLYGIKSLEKDYEEFYDKGFHLTAKYSANYKPNPFCYQYDLTFHIFLNFNSILDKEIARIRRLAKIKKSKKLHQKANDMSIEKHINGITREDFLFAAAEMRWPTEDLDGQLFGKFVRDPWCERRVKGICSEHNFVFTFGGGGQGKTHIFLAFMLMLFEHFIFTEKGARCMFSTVNKDKLEGVAWPYLQSLLNATGKNISLYAGKSKISGGWTLKRPGTRDTGGVFKGILVGRTMNDSTVVDKLTGSHKHPAVAYLIDEAQSTPIAPIKASTNFTMHSDHVWIFAAGNYDEDGDSLGLNVRPECGGWTEVDEHTGEWISTTTTGQKAYVIHLNNEDSPGMTDEGAHRYPHLPNREKLNRLYPIAVNRDIHTNNHYRRFWVGWRVENKKGNAIITRELAEQGDATLPIRISFRKPYSRFMSFDSAPSETDRNVVGIFLEGIDESTGEWIWGIERFYRLNKASQALQYYKESTNDLYRIILENKVKSGDVIMDWTNRTAHAELLQDRGISVKTLIYNACVPDGRRPDTITRSIRGPFLVDPDKNVFAHQIANNNIAYGAYALQQYIINGRFRGLVQGVLSPFASDMGDRTEDDEFYARQFIKVKSRDYGELVGIDSKIDFKKKHGFSPDPLDVLFQAAYFMSIFRGMPLVPVKDRVRKQKQEVNSELDDHNKLWDDTVLGIDEYEQDIEYVEIFSD